LSVRFTSPRDKYYDSVLVINI